MYKLGVIYLALGKNANREALLSAKSSKKYNHDIPICIFTDRPYQTNKHFFDVIKDIDVVSKGFPAIEKVSAVTQTPFENTLFLDCDTKVFGKLDALFDALHEHDFAICNEPGPNGEYKNPRYFNTGVFAFKQSDSWIRFSRTWLEEVINAPEYRMSGKWVNGEFQDHEQGILNELIWEKDYHTDVGLSLKVMDSLIYNARGGIFKKLKREGRWNDVIVGHCHSLHHPLWRKIKDKAISCLRSLRE